ncbi:MAG: SAM-dependent methyltransferase, partial [Pseudomonadota bacterium]
DIHGALNPGGYFHVGLKVGTGEARDAIGRFYAYYGVQELQDLLTETGFTVVWTHEGHEMGMAGTLDPFVLMQARA